jgi:hypothetical protein
MLKALLAGSALACVAVAGPTGTFLPRPAAARLQAVLVNSAGASMVLCAGSGYVPVEFRRPARIIIQPGTAPTC